MDYWAGVYMGLQILMQVTNHLKQGNIAGIGKIVHLRVTWHVFGMHWDIPRDRLRPGWQAPHRTPLRLNAHCWFCSCRLMSLSFGLQ